MSNSEAAERHGDSDKGLFGALPQARRPTTIQEGRFTYKDCESCRGSGRRRYSAISGNYYADRFSEPCKDCGGGGKRLLKARGKKR
jgi:hypothetical protein